MNQQRSVVPEAGTVTRLASAVAFVAADQTLSDEDQTRSDTDQTTSDADQTRSDADQDAADADQEASDEDHVRRGSGDDASYEASRSTRQDSALVRFGTALGRADAAIVRDRTAVERDQFAAERDVAAEALDRDLAALEAQIGEIVVIDPPSERRLQALRALAHRTRQRAALDRDRAALDRAAAAQDRAELVAELRTAHLDALTGAYQRAMGRLALDHEVARAGREAGTLVLAFVDVDGLKAVNDSLGHAAGDDLLQAVARVMRAHLRTYDPLVRWGGDEFLTALPGVTVAEAMARFARVRAALEQDEPSTISVGLAQWEAGETLDHLIERADADLLERRRGARA